MTKSSVTRVALLKWGTCVVCLGAVALAWSKRAPEASLPAVGMTVQERPVAVAPSSLVALDDPAAAPSAEIVSVVAVEPAMVAEARDVAQQPASKAEIRIVPRPGGAALPVVAAAPMPASVPQPQPDDTGSSLAPSVAVEGPVALGRQAKRTAPSTLQKRTHRSHANASATCIPFLWPGDVPDRSRPLCGQPATKRKTR